MTTMSWVLSFGTKYLKIFIDERIRLKGMEFELSKLVRSKTNYYKGEMTEDELDKRGW